MKKPILALSLFLIVFSSVYCACCYLIPGWRIKLEADGLTYFLESLRSMVLIKTAISLLAGSIAAVLPFFFSALFRKR